MEVSKITANFNVTKANETSESKSPDKIQLFQGHDDILADNMRKEEETKKSVSAALNSLAQKKQISLKSPLIGNSYINFTGDKKMTYGQLRKMLGIPPGRISRNKGNGKHTDNEVIQGTIRLELNDIGYFERRMDNLEAQDVKWRRDHGEPDAGYQQALKKEEILKCVHK